VCAFALCSGTCRDTASDVERTRLKNAIQLAAVTICTASQTTPNHSQRTLIKGMSLAAALPAGYVSTPASSVRRTHRPLNTSVNVQKLWRINCTSSTLLDFCLVPALSGSVPFLRFSIMNSSREPLPCVADYGARRAGGEQENLRRAQRRESPPPAQQSSAYEQQSLGWGADTGREDSRHAERRSVAPDPRNVRRRSVEYASRRSGGDPENQRRRSSSAMPRHVPPTQNGAYSSSYISDAAYSSLPPPADGPKMDPRVQRRQSVDYAARRSGSGRASSAPAQRSSRGHVITRQVPSEPSSSSGGSYNSSSHGASPHVVPRQSVDYSARRGGDPENTRRRIAASPSASTRALTPSVISRKTTDYASRRSGGQEENLRRRSQDFSIPPGSGSPPQVPVTASEALERVRQLAARRRSTPDYAARVSSTTQGYNNGLRRGSSSPTAAPRVALSASSNGVHHSSYDHSNSTAKRAEERANKPYIARKSVPSYASRRSQDFTDHRPGDPRRRRSMARFTLAEVKTALANRKRSQSGTLSQCCMLRLYLMLSLMHGLVSSESTMTALINVYGTTLALGKHFSFFRAV
jgi:hypothetical protein